MIGRRVDTTYAREYADEAGTLVLEVKGLAADNGIRDIDLRVHAGEIVGLGGLAGAGRTEVARAIFGADRITAGEVWLGGERVTGGPDRTTRLGMALIPESRKQEGLALIRTVSDNLLAASLAKLFPSRWFSRSAGERISDGTIRQLRIVTPSARQLVQLLSGGNQQKIVIGKWLTAGTRLFIFDEPTRGIDVGAKAEVFALIDQLVKRGAAVLMISSELGEIVKVCDRAYVMAEGRITGHLERDQLSEENILRLAMHHG
jgi:ribose transport system ATP-binding protein